MLQLQHMLIPAMASCASSSSATPALRQYQSVPLLQPHPRACVATPAVGFPARAADDVPCACLLHQPIPHGTCAPTAVVTPALRRGGQHFARALPQVQVFRPPDSLTLMKRSSVWEAVGPPRPERTFHCPFCLENAREAARVTFAACGNDSHGVCQECMGHYIRGLVKDGRVGKIECHRCGASAVPAEVLQLTDVLTFRKYERFRQMQQDHTVRECPRCSRLNRPSIDEAGNPVAEMRCQYCPAKFCYYHSNAHEGLPCAEYRKRVAREERLAEQGAGLRDTKACPLCGVRTEKTGGCNHMTCQRCGADWCWMCGAKLEDVTAHYYFGGPLACGQFDDFEPCSPLSYTIRLVTLPLQILSLLLFLLLSLTVLVWFPLVYIVLMPCYFNVWKCSMPAGALKCVMLCSVVLAFVPFVIFQVSWTLAAALVWCVLQLCGAERRHLSHMVRAPMIAILPVLIWCQVLIEYMSVRPEPNEDDEARGGSESSSEGRSAANGESDSDASPSHLSASDASSTDGSDGLVSLGV